MNELLVYILILALSLWLLARPYESQATSNNLMQGQLRRLWLDAKQNLAQNNRTRAERSLLALLKLDAKNVLAYDRLGIMYAQQGLKKEAIECFEISSSISQQAGSFHNLALVYYNDGQYEKAARAFEHAIEKDPENPTRYMALAKTFEKMEEPKAAIKELEKAHRLSPGGQGSVMLINAYKQIGEPELAAQVVEESRKLRKLAQKATTAK